MEDTAQIKADIAELKINTATIKLEITEMKKSVGQSISKISESLILLATITEKLNQNIEEHRIMHKRIDAVEEMVEDATQAIADLTNKYNLMKVQYEGVQAQRTREETERRNSLSEKVKDKALEWFFVFLFSLIVYVLYSHVRDFLTLTQQGGANQPQQTITVPVHPKQPQPVLTP